MTTAILALENGHIFYGQSVGVPGIRQGEAVFNTAMTGYQEILTDPSYASQIITFTHPHIGNTGVNSQDEESHRIWAAGVVVRSFSSKVSSWRSEQTLQEYLIRHNIVAIAGVDTRALTRILREEGAQKACLMAGNMDVEVALQQAKAFSGLKGLDLTAQVTTAKSYVLPPQAFSSASEPPFRIAVMDFGVKTSILRQLQLRNAEVTVVPASTSADVLLNERWDGIVLSNGPGDPAACTDILKEIKKLIQADLPVLGICLGCQLLALACGAKTYKMKFGHHGANHPVKCLETGSVLITSQNHGFAVDETSLPGEWTITHRSLFDQSLQGFRHRTKSIVAFQGHPEAGPGPEEARVLFTDFFQAMEAHRITNARSLMVEF